MAKINDIVAGMTYVKFVVDNLALEKGLQKSEGLVKRFGDVCASVGSKMAASGAMLTAPFANAVRVFTQFDDQMRMTKAVTGATGDEFDLLIKRARQIGRDTAFSASQAAAGMTALGQMGFSTKEIDQASGSVVDLALATGTDLAQSADIAANSLRMFKLKASDMTRVADVLTATANGSAQTLSDLFEAMKMAGPQAAIARESIEDVSAAIGMMANVGIKGSMAGTAIRNAYVKMADSKTQSALEQYNIKTVDANNNLRKLKDIIIDVAKAMQSMGTAQKMAFAEEIFGLRGAQVGLTLGDNVEGMLEFSRMLEQDSKGKARKTREEKEGGIGGAFRELSSALEDVNHALAGTINEMLVPLLKKFSEIAKAVSQWIAENAGLVRSLAIGAGALLALGAALTATSLGIAAVASVTGNLGAVFAKIASPIKEYHQAAKDAVQHNLDLVNSKKVLEGVAYAQAKAEGAAVATAHAQQQVTAAQTALAKARPGAEHAAAYATRMGAAANLEQAKAAEAAAVANLQAVQAAEAKATAYNKMTIAQKHEAASAVAAAAAKEAAEKRLAVCQADLILYQKKCGYEVAQATGINVVAAKESMNKAQADYNTAVANYKVAHSEAAKAAAVQAALSPQAAQLAGAKKMLSMLRLQPTAINMAMASFLALSNAQAGAAAKAALLSWLKSMKSVNATTSLLVIKNKLGTLWTNTFTAAMARQAIVSGAVAVKNALASASIAGLGVVSKIAAGGVLGLTKALEALVAHPILAGLSALALLYYGISKAIKAAAEKTATLVTSQATSIQFYNQERQKSREANAIRDEQDFSRLRELSAASQQAKLTADEVEEAEYLLSRLGSRGFSNLPKLDKLTGTLQEIGEAAKESFDTVKQQIARQDIRQEYQDKQKELAERKKIYRELLQKGTGWQWFQEKEVYRKQAKKEFPRMQELSRELFQEKEVYRKQAKKEFARMQELSRELDELNKKALEADAAIAGTKAEQKEKTLSVSVTANADAQKRLAEISKKISDDRLSDIEKEIDGIRDLRDEYVKLLNTRLAFEKGKAKQDSAAIADLEKQLAEAGEVFAGMEDAAYEKHYKDMSADLDALSAKHEAERRRSEETARERAMVESMEKESPGQYRDFLNQLLEEATAGLSKITSAYKSLFAEVTSETSERGKGISEQEKQRLDIQKELYDQAQSRIDFLRGKLLDLDLDGIKATATSQVSLASFKTADILNLLGGASGPEEEIARNTRATASNLASLIDIVRSRKAPAFS